VESFPDFDPRRDDELKQLLDRLVAEERALSTERLKTPYERRVLHGKIDIIGPELVRRRRRREGGDESGRPGES
jgi:hypothetical protein